MDTEAEFIRRNIGLVDAALRRVMTKVPDQRFRDDIRSAGLEALMEVYAKWDSSRHNNLRNFTFTIVTKRMHDEKRRLYGRYRPEFFDDKGELTGTGARYLAKRQYVSPDGDDDPNLYESMAEPEGIIPGEIPANVMVIERRIADIALTYELIEDHYCRQRRRALATSSMRNREILLAIARGEKYSIIGKRLGLTPSRISQIYHEFLDAAPKSRREL